MKKTLLILTGVSALCAQVNDADRIASVQRYLGSGPASHGSSGSPAPESLRTKFAALNGMQPGKRPVASSDGIDLRSLLPGRRPYSFIAYLVETHTDVSGALAEAAAQVAERQVNKMLTGGSGNQAVTSLLSGSAAPDFLGFATEYGAVSQTRVGNLSTLHANLAGALGAFYGDPYLGCQSLAVGGCSPTSRFLRGFSASLSLESPSSSGGKTVSGTNAATGSPGIAPLLQAGTRMGAWGARYDFQHKTLYDSKILSKFAKEWITKMAEVSASATDAELGASISAVMEEAGANGPGGFIAELQAAPAGQLASVMGQQLDRTVSAMLAADPQLMTKVLRARRAIQASFDQRDAVLSELQSNKFSVEFNGVHALGQPNLSNVRAIYSYQLPGEILLTFNGAAEWYDAVPAGVKVSRFRDAQAAAQIERPLGKVPKLGPATLTLAFYYQWMKDNALISIPAGNNAPGTSITLPAAASTLLAASGNIGVGQVKVTIPVKGGLIKIPFSFTWSSRTELINESEKRGQIGLTLDLDSVFAK